MLASVGRRFFHTRLLLGGTALAAAASFGTQPAEFSVAPSAALDPNEWTPLKLVHKHQLTKGDRPTHLLRFELPTNQPHLPVASCLLVRLPVGKEKEDGTPSFVIRPYTPVSTPDAKTLDLAVKIYPDGKLTPYLAGLKTGDVLDFKGPLPKLALAEASGKKSIGMIAGGTGITPMLQLASELLRKGYSGPIRLIYANVNPDEIMLKDLVDGLARKHKNFSVYYVVDKADKQWNGGVGYVTADMLKAQLPPKSEDSLVLVCGPPGMMKAVSGEKVSPKDQGPLSGLLKEHLGYTEAQVYKF